MSRERALKVMVKQDPALAMMRSFDVTLALLPATRFPQPLSRLQRDRLRGGFICPLYIQTKED
ncbi:MAG TPA: hypothetical protein VEJ67_04655 [Candidatus Cybelea sp.]|nr:hypothetical protein [Candidatus Cybelea sp.]